MSKPPLDLAFSRKLPSPAEMACMDRRTVAAGVPPLELMERAGQAVFDELHAWPKLKDLTNPRILILCGPGNNGGDGLVLARLLLQSGALPKTVLCSTQRYSEDCLAQMSRFVMSGGELLFLNKAPESLSGFKHAVLSEKDMYYSLEQSELVVDALLGTGQQGPPHGDAAALIGILNRVLEKEEHPPLVASIDIPSGIDAGTGAVHQPAIRADFTIAIELFKRGMLQYPARQNCARTSAVSIGLDTEGPAEFSLILPGVIDALLERPGDYHKNMAGSIYVLGGSDNMPGAPLLAASAALHAGAGLVTMAAIAGTRELQRPAELMLDFPQNPQSRRFGPGAQKDLQRRLSGCDCLVLGPGLGTAPSTRKFVAALLRWISKEEFPAVIDADALNILSLEKKFPALSSCILTPHPGEMARLLGCKVSQVQADRFAAVKKLHRKTGATCVLKGAGSLVFASAGGFVNSTGGPYLATAGSGDVLAGIIAGFFVQLRHRRHAQLHAACAGVFLHGLCGEGCSPLTASELIRRIPCEMRSLSESMYARNP